MGKKYRYYRQTFLYFEEADWLNTNDDVCDDNTNFKVFLSKEMFLQEENKLKELVTAQFGSTTW